MLWKHVKSKSWSFNTSVSPLSGREDGAGVAVALPHLLSLLLAVGSQRLLQLFLALEKISTRAHDLLFDFAVALHVREYFVQSSFPLHRRSSWRPLEKERVNKQISLNKAFLEEGKLRNIFSSRSTWSPASVNKGVFWGGLLIIKVKLSWG